MSYTDAFLEEFSNYTPKLTRRADFDVFWKETLEESGRVPLRPSAEAYDYPGLLAKVWDIAYDGFDGTRIHGWYIVPEYPKREKYPCLVHYHGYTGNRGKPADFMQWAALGTAVVSVDCRGQRGNTGSRSAYSCGSAQSAVCNGILDRYEYYYRAVYMDCVRALDFACSRVEVDESRLVAEGVSQGGSLAMAVCALDGRPWMALADVPSNSDLGQRVEGLHGSYSAVADYLRAFPAHTDRAFETLSYFDTMNLADRIACKVLASVGLKDDTCPARLYFATYNRITSPKRICLYPFCGHGDVGAAHIETKQRYLWENLNG